MNARYLLAAAPALWLASLLGCTNDDGGGGAGMSGGEDRELFRIGAQLEGIYELTAHQLNQQACEAGGAQVAGHTFFALVTLGRPALAEVRVLSCESVEACRDSVDALMNGGSYLTNFQFVLTGARDGDSLIGTDGVAVLAGDTCFRILTDALVEQGEDGELSIEAKIWYGEDYAPGDDGSCNTGGGDVPSMDEPCAELEQLAARRVADL